MSWRPAATTTTLASPKRGRALTRRIADCFGLSYPHEFASAVSLLIALILLRVITVMHYKFGADEPQHLHVIWGWLEVLFSIAISLITTCRCFRFYAHRFTSLSATAQRA